MPERVWVLIASRSYLRPLPKGLKAPRTADELLRHDCIVYSELATQTPGPSSPGQARP